MVYCVVLGLGCILYTGCDGNVAGFTASTTVFSPTCKRIKALNTDVKTSSLRRTYCFALYCVVYCLWNVMGHDAGLCVASGRRRWPTWSLWLLKWSRLTRLPPSKSLSACRRSPLTTTTVVGAAFSTPEALSICLSVFVFFFFPALSFFHSFALFFLFFSHPSLKPG